MHIGLPSTLNDTSLPAQYDVCAGIKRCAAVKPDSWGGRSGTVRRAHHERED